MPDATTEFTGFLNGVLMAGRFRQGTGSPEGALVAPVGSLFLRRDGSTSTTLYVKESGTGNTGWAAVGGGSDPTGPLTLTSPSSITPVLTLETTATNDDPTEMVMQTRVVTTDANPTGLATFAVGSVIPVSDHCTILITGYIVARRTGGTAGTANDGAAYRIEAAYKYDSGDDEVTEIAAETLTVIGESQAGWTVTATPDLNDIDIAVTGATDNTVTWHGTFRVYWVGT